MEEEIGFGGCGTLFFTSFRWPFSFSPSSSSSLSSQRLGVHGHAHHRWQGGRGEGRAREHEVLDAEAGEPHLQVAHGRAWRAMDYVVGAARRLQCHGHGSPGAVAGGFVSYMQQAVQPEDGAAVGRPNGAWPHPMVMFASRAWAVVESRLLTSVCLLT